MKTKLDLKTILHNYHIDYCYQYGEPGYTEPEGVILFADWNEVPQEIQDQLQEDGHELEWSDEWHIDHNHGKAWRTEADSYHWMPSYVITEDGEILTPDDGIEAIIEECAITDPGQPVKSLPASVTQHDLIMAGYEQVNDAPYANGLHPGQTDDPAEIVKRIFATHDVESIVFEVSVSQFFVKFNVWVKELEK